jgi:hypothetical protein
VRYVAGTGETVSSLGALDIGCLSGVLRRGTLSHIPPPANMRAKLAYLSSETMKAYTKLLQIHESNFNRKSDGGISKWLQASDATERMTYDLKDC